MATAGFITRPGLWKVFLMIGIVLLLVAFLLGIELKKKLLIKMKAIYFVFVFFS
jgi:hypothetical protein